MWLVGSKTPEHLQFIPDNMSKMCFLVILKLSPDCNSLLT